MDESILGHAQGEAAAATILLVEDHEEFRRMLLELTSSFGYMVVATSDAPEALRTFQASPETIQLLLTDLDLPGMNGLTLAEQLLQGKPGLKVIYMSACFPSAMPSLTPGQVCALQKPFCVAALREALHDLLPAAPPP